MDLHEAMRSTAASRNFTAETVDLATIARVLDDARFAPSGGNRQPWRVIAVSDPEQKRRLRDEYLAAYRAMPVRPAPELDRFAEHLDQVPVLLVVCAELAALSITDAALDRPSIVGGASIYPFVQNILLGLGSEGLAGVLTTVACPREAQLREIFGIPDGFAVACVIPVGHPARPRPRPTRRPVEQFAWIDRFGGTAIANRPRAAGPAPGPAMSLEPPSPEEIARAARALDLHLSDADLTRFGEVIAGAIDLLRPLDAPEEPAPGSATARYPRSDWRKPDAREDPLHAWYVKASIRGAGAGPLAGRGVVLKDNICVAGLPMMVGASTLEGYVPDVDATVVTRILDAGGEILGKANCEYFCFSAGSHTNATGPTHNPYRHGHSSGGSSSGCAALVGSGAVEMAIGGDQGGSIRQPSAMCGVYGLKPTHGLVPYTGVFPVDHTLDHIGPMTSSVAANALLLEAIAGEDGVDPRQRSVRVGAYTEAVGAGARGIRIALLNEGFGHPGANPAVEEAVRALGRRLAEAGATVSEVSVAAHRERSVSVWAAIAIEGTAELAMRDCGIGAGHSDGYVLSLARAHARWSRRADELPDLLKASLIAAHHLRERYHGEYYAKAQNLARALRRAYDEALGSVDLLLMPTIPFTAPALPRSADEPGPGFEAVVNTAAFNVTGHPALSLPCGMHDGLPIGAMLVGRHWDEATIYRVAAAAESLGDWRDW